MRVVWCVLLSVALAGCAAHRGASFRDAQGAEAPPASGDTSAILEDVMARARDLASEARPEPEQKTTIEGQDLRLASALVAVTAYPHPETYRAVAREYARLNVFDQAHQYLDRALTLDRRDGATYDARARLARDSGMPHLALGDAHRAVFFAPDSPIVRNTLGTVLQALGKKVEAREQYEAALRLDPSASYALNNLCYGWMLDGDIPRAVQACEQALMSDPGLVAARNNLGILYGARGEIDAARAAFAQSGDEASAFYNMGVVHLARREYREAANAFEAAQQARPTQQAAARVRQSVALATAGEDQ